MCQHFEGNRGLNIDLEWFEGSAFNFANLSYKNLRALQVIDHHVRASYDLSSTKLSDAIQDSLTWF